MTTFRSSGDGLRDAVRMADHKRPWRPPTEDDVPRPGKFPGRQPKPIPGQLDLYGDEVELVEAEVEP